MPRSRPPTGLLLAALTACGGAGPTVPSGPRASILIAGDAVSDTIGATFSDSLDITVLGTGGVPVPKVDVNLSSAIDGFGRIQFLVPEPVSFATLRTDAAGRLRVKVRAAELAGSARFTVGVTSLRLLDTGAYTVLPGQPGGVRALLRDTALQVGRALTMRARTIDRFGNPRTDPVTFSSPDPGVAVAGARVTAGAIGRWRIASSSAGFSDTSLVSVVPSGLLAAGNAGGLYVFETDYTGFRKVAGVQTNFTAWTPNKPEVLTARVFSPELTAVGLDGGTRQLLSTSLGLSAV
ncbi:MAG TPA: hypothetical protein VFU23_04080, partial [Gemmatimonadales bacterium]|nr:hypothetical protein [Gemmatimonadales bacterium]